MTNDPFSPDTKRPAVSVFETTPKGRAQRDAILARNAAIRARFPEDPRRAYAEICAQTPVANGVTFTEIANTEVSGWRAEPTTANGLKMILFIHGGGYGFGDAASYRGLTSQIAARTGCPVIGIDYPLAPEHLFPAAFNAACRARRWLLDNEPGDYALVGDSAGGGLCLALLAEDPDVRPPACVVAFSPWTDLALTGPSLHSTSTGDVIFQRTYLEEFAEAYLGGAAQRDRRASPLYAVPDDGPPLLIQVARQELLLDDSRRYAETAAAQGADVTLEIHDGLYHVFQRDVGHVDEAGQALDRVAGFIGRHW